MKIALLVKRALIGLSIVLNALVLAFALYLWLGQPFRDWVHPFLTNAATSFFEAYPISNGEIVFVGDSITAGGRWHEMFPGLPVRNRGISGDRTDDILERIEQITNGPPAKIFLEIGTNDLGTGVGEMVILENYAAILDTFRRQAPSSTIYVQSVLPRSVEYRERVERLNRGIAALAAERNLALIDLYPTFLASDGSIRDELSYDELHLSGEGYRTWQKQLESLVR